MTLWFCDMISEYSTTMDETGAIQVTAAVKMEKPERAQTETTETCKEVKETSTKHFVDILANLRESYDTLIYLVCGECTREVTANKCILEAISPEFRRIFKQGPQNQPNKRLVFALDNLGFFITDFLNLVDFIYTGKVTLTLENVENMMRVAGYFEVQALINLCEEYFKSVLNNDNCVQLFLVLCKNDTAVTMTKSLAGVKKALKEYIRLYVRGLIKDHMIYKYSTGDILHLLHNNCLTELKDANAAFQFASSMLDRCLLIQHHQGMEVEGHHHGIEVCSNDQNASEAAKVAISFLLEDLGTMSLSVKKSLHARVVSLHNKAKEQCGIVNLFDIAMIKLTQSLVINRLSTKSETVTSLLFTPVTLSHSSQTLSNQIKVIRSSVNKNTTLGTYKVTADINETEATASFTKDQMKIETSSVGEKSNVSQFEVKEKDTVRKCNFETSDINKDVSGVFGETLPQTSFGKINEIDENDISVGKLEQLIDSSHKTNFGEGGCEEVRVVIENVKVEPDDSWTPNITLPVQESEILSSMNAFESSGALELCKSETGSFERNFEQNGSKNPQEKEYLDTQIKVEKVNDDGSVDRFVVWTQNQDQSHSPFSDSEHGVCDKGKPFLPTVVKQEQSEKSAGEGSDSGKIDDKQEQTSVKRIHTNKSILYTGFNVPIEHYYLPSEKRKKTAKLPVTIKKQKCEEQKQNFKKVAKDSGHKSKGQGHKKKGKSGIKVILIPKFRLKKVVQKSDVHQKETLI